MDDIAVTTDKSSIVERSKRYNEPGWLAEIRSKAFEAFDETPWPSPEAEEWRRTNLDEYKLNDRDIIAALMNTHGNGNGRNGEKSRRLRLLEEARPLLERVAQRMDDRFAALNLVGWSGSRIVYVPEGTALKEPVVIEYPGSPGGVNNVHTAVILGREAKATVFQHFAGGGSGALWNAGVSAELGEGAKLTFANIQQVDESARFFQQFRYFLHDYAVLDSFESYTGATLTKTRNEVFIEGSGSEALLNGIYFANSGQHMDMRTVQYHTKRSSQSRAFFKGAVSGSGSTVYQGLIDVDGNAPGTDAYLTNKNLILNDGARADSIPCLEIRTDDVKCSHGSTSGRIDEEELFYLMSRGLPRSVARRELIAGFFEDLVQKAPEQAQEPVRARIAELID